MIPNEELKIEFYDLWEGRGMRPVAVPKGVKITHIPTNTIAISNSARSTLRHQVKRGVAEIVDRTPANYVKGNRLIVREALHGILLKEVKDTY